MDNFSGFGSDRCTFPSALVPGCSYFLVLGLNFLFHILNTGVRDLSSVSVE